MKKVYVLLFVDQRQVHTTSLGVYARMEDAIAAMRKDVLQFVSDLGFSGLDWGNLPATLETAREIEDYAIEDDVVEIDGCQYDDIWVWKIEVKEVQ